MQGRHFEALARSLSGRPATAAAPVLRRSAVSRPCPDQALVAGGDAHGSEEAAEPRSLHGLDVIE